MRTPGAPVAADGEQQHSGAPPERLMRQLPRHAVPRGALLTTTAAPPILLSDPARQHRTAGLRALTYHLQPELIKAAESGQVGAGETRATSSVVHVEVFLIGSVRTPII